MASKNDSDNDIVPMGKAIAIIVSVVLGVVVLVGGGVFVAMSLNKTNTSVANSSKQTTVQEGIVGTWEYTSKSSSSSFTSMYGYNFKEDGSYIWTNVVGDTFIDEIATHTIKESGTYSVLGDTVSLKNEETGETSKIKVKIISDKEISVNDTLYKRYGNYSSVENGEKIIDDKSSNANGNDSEKIIGEWIKEMGNDLHMTLVFENDDTYKLIIPQVRLGKSVDYDYIYHSGTYELKGTTLKLYITYNVSSAKTEEYEIEFDSNKIVFINKISGSPLSETFYKK